MLRMWLAEEVEVQERTQMMKRDRKKQEKRLIGNFWHGQKLVNSLLETNLHLRFQTETRDFMELHLRETV